MRRQRSAEPAVPHRVLALLADLVLALGQRDDFLEFHEYHHGHGSRLYRDGGNIRYVRRSGKLQQLPQLRPKRQSIASRLCGSTGSWERDPQRPQGSTPKTTLTGCRLGHRDELALSMRRAGASLQRQRVWTDSEKGGFAPSECLLPQDGTSGLRGKSAYSREPRLRLNSVNVFDRPTVPPGHADEPCARPANGRSSKMQEFAHRD